MSKLTKAQWALLMYLFSGKTVRHYSGSRSWENEEGQRVAAKTIMGLYNDKLARNLRWGGYICLVMTALGKQLARERFEQQ